MYPGSNAQLENHI